MGALNVFCFLFFQKMNCIKNVFWTSPESQDCKIYILLYICIYNVHISAVIPRKSRNVVRQLYKALTIVCSMSPSATVMICLKRTYTSWKMILYSRLSLFVSPLYIYCKKEVRLTFCTFKWCCFIISVGSTFACLFHFVNF